MSEAKYERVSATWEERQDYRDKHKGFGPGVYRYRCTWCGKRLWGSGLGIGSHNRSKACELENIRLREVTKQARAEVEATGHE
jgi:hypothetical protein